jgi:large subunit ribosomal protein L4
MAKLETKKKAKVEKTSPDGRVSLEAKILSADGKEKGSLDLPESIFGLPWNADLVHQVVTSYMSNKRTPVAHTKDRAEVAGGGKKPWRQKGTGRARHGSIRSPLWRGGGITFGPSNERNYDKKVNKKMRTKALFIVLSKKFRDGEVFFVEDFKVNEPKTAVAKKALESLSKISGLDTLISKKKNSAAILLNTKDADVERSLANFGNIEVGEVRNLNILDILTVKNVIITSPVEAFKTLQSKLK